MSPLAVSPGPSVESLVAGHRDGFGLAREFYTDQAVFDREMRRVLGGNWLLAGLSASVRQPGDYLTFDVAGESLLVIRDDGGALRALFNVCRHRGSRLCTESAGHVGKLVCPYHQWSYERDGRLAGARWMPDIDKSAYPLFRAHVEEAAGLIFVCLADDPPPFDAARRAIVAHAQPYRLDRLRVCLVREYEVRANWKLLVENNRECYHCPGGHPEFCKVNFDVGMPGDPRADEKYERHVRDRRAHWRAHHLATEAVNFPGDSWFRVARMPLRQGCVTESMDGQPVAPTLGELTTPDAGSLRIINLPGAWVHVLSDYVNPTQLFPVSPTLTRARISWFVREDARPGSDFDPERVAAFWKITTEQDWKLCEDTQAGVGSRRYVPGPHSPIAEPGVTCFNRWYLKQLTR